MGCTNCDEWVWYGIIVLFMIAGVACVWPMIIYVPQMHHYLDTTCNVTAIHRDPMALGSCACECNCLKGRPHIKDCVDKNNSGGIINFSKCNFQVCWGSCVDYPFTSYCKTCQYKTYTASIDFTWWNILLAAPQHGTLTKTVNNRVNQLNRWIHTYEPTFPCSYARVNHSGYTAQYGHYRRNAKRVVIGMSCVYGGLALCILIYIGCVCHACCGCCRCKKGYKPI